jgi:hypothetical protein
MKDLCSPGDRYGRLVLIERVPHDPKRGLRWKVRCDCGTEYDVNQGTFRQKGGVLSCGCLRRERQRAAVTKHGQACTPLHQCWNNMKARCSNPNHPLWKWYGERGISVCEEWRDSFEAFHQWAAPLWEKGLQLDRIDNNGNYEPTNCRFVPAKKNARNRRDNRLIQTEWGEMTCAEAADRVGLPRNIVANRIHSLGWSVEKALTTPYVPYGPRPRKRRSPEPGRVSR